MGLVTKTLGCNYRHCVCFKVNVILLHTSKAKNKHESLECRKLTCSFSTYIEYIPSVNIQNKRKTNIENDNACWEWRKARIEEVRVR